MNTNYKARQIRKLSMLTTVVFLFLKLVFVAQIAGAHTRDVKSGDARTTDQFPLQSVTNTGIGPVSTISTVAICNGTTSVDIPIKVSGFTNVGNINLTLSYNPGELGEASLLSQDASLNSWGSRFIVSTSTISGTITISGNGAGITLPNGTTLLTFHFSKLSPITNGNMIFNENIQGTACEYSPDTYPSYTPFIDTPTADYYINGGVTVTTLPTASISYSGSPFCTSANAQNVSLSGSGGTFSSTLGLSINETSGIITPTTSTAADYIVSYVIPAAAGCPSITVTTTVTINPLPSVSLSVGGTATINSGTATNVTVSSSEIGTSYQLRNDNANQLIGSPLTGNGGTISLTTGNLTSTTTFNVYATLGSCSAELTAMAVITIATITSTIVTNTDDSGPGSFRDVVANLPEGGVILFDDYMSGRLIVLNSPIIINKNISFDNHNLLLGTSFTGNGDIIIINPGKNLTLTNGSRITVLGNIRNNNGKGGGGLIILSGASFIHNTVDLQATVKRLLNPGWHLFGSPFKQNTGSSLAGLIPVGGNVQMIPYSNGVNWGSIVSSPYYYFSPTSGYAVKPSAAVTATLTGNLYYSPYDYTISLIYNGMAATQSWNLVANPYTSYINWNLLGKTNLNTSLYLWDNALYPLYTPVTNAAYFRTYNSCNNVGVPAGTTPFIAPLQGFFVRAVYTAPKLSFLPSARLHSSLGFYKGYINTEILVRIKIENEQGADELVICKNPDASLDLEKFDSEKLFGGLPLEIFSQSASGEKLVINTINTTQTIIPLGINGSAGVKTRITAFDLESKEQIFLEDRLKGKLTRLSESTTYDFEFPADNIINRFFIRFGAVNTTLNPLTSSDLKVFENNHELNIIAQTGEELQQIEVFTLTGAAVYKSEVGGMNVFSAKLNLSNGIYLVKVKTSISTQNVKVNWK